jgi:enoyl-CoA hydratase
MTETEAMTNEFQHGLSTLFSGESLAGANRFQQGQGKHGK